MRQVIVVTPQCHHNRAKHECLQCEREARSVTIAWTSAPVPLRRLPEADGVRSSLDPVKPFEVKAWAPTVTDATVFCGTLSTSR